jgi:hypothetical protein
MIRLAGVNLAIAIAVLLRALHTGVHWFQGQAL